MFKMESKQEREKSIKQKTLQKGGTLGNGDKMATLTKKDNSVLDMNRARNLGIAMRRVGMSPDEVVKAIDELDTDKIPADKAELLRNDFWPTDEEVAAIKDRLENTTKKLAPIDDFMYKLHSVERGKQRLTLMMQIESCGDAAKSVMPAAMSVLIASSSVTESAKLKKVLQIILAFGNRMNSNRRGGAWGFKLTVFDRLIDTKSNDKKRNLMHFVAAMILKTDPGTSQN